MCSWLSPTVPSVPVSETTCSLLSRTTPLAPLAEIEVAWPVTGTVCPGIPTPFTLPKSESNEISKDVTAVFKVKVTSNAFPLFVK